MDSSKFHYNSPRFYAIKKWYRLKISSELTSFLFLLLAIFIHSMQIYIYSISPFVSFHFFYVFCTHTGSVCHPWIVNETRIYFKMSTKLHNLCDMLDAVCVYVYEYVTKARSFLYSRWEAQNCMSHSYPLPWLVEWHCTSEFPLFLTFFIFFLSTYSSSASYSSWFFFFFYFCSTKNNWHCRKFMVNIFDAFQLI